MRYRVVVAAGIAAAMLTAAGCGGDEDGNSGESAKKPASIKVWLQTDAQTGWQNVVDAANKEFKTKTGINVTVEYQQWTDHLTKLDAALSGSQAPDVVEMGNTETTKYLAAGAFADLSGHESEFENAGSWLPGLKDSCTFDGKLGCVPYYAGSRVAIYNKELFAKAGITDPKPRSLDDLFAMLSRVKAANTGDPNFSAFFMPGRYWYAAMSFVKDYGGDIATKNGDSWQGTLDSPQAQQGVTKWKELVDSFSKAPKTQNENNQYLAFAKGNVAMMLGLGWEAAAPADPKAQGNPKLKGKIGIFPMPSHNAGQNMPAFLGGSDLAVPAKSKNADWARQWIATFTNTQNETQLAAKGNVPNSATLSDKVPAETRPIAEAAKTSWFTPVAPGWPTVESQNTLQNGLVDIVTGKSSVADGLAKMSDQVSATLQAGT